MGDLYHTPAQAVTVAVLLPHRHQVAGAENKSLQALVELEDLHQRARHQGIAQADDVPQEHTASSIEMVSGNPHRLGLEFEECPAELSRNAELRKSRPRLLGEVVGHLQVDQIRRHKLLSGPTLLEDRRQLVGDIEAEAVVPPCLEPGGELGAGVMVEDVDVELALALEARQRQVAAAEKADGRIDLVRAMDEIKLGVQRVA